MCTVFPERSFDFFVSPCGNEVGARDRQARSVVKLRQGNRGTLTLLQDELELENYHHIPRAIFGAIRVHRQRLNDAVSASPILGDGDVVTPSVLPFILFALPRTGSNTLSSVLAAHQEITITKEPFNPDYVRWGEVDYLSHTSGTPQLNWVLEDLRTRFTGFKHLAYQQPWRHNRRILESVDKRIFLYRRNAFDACVSNKLAKQAGDWLNRKEPLVKTRFEPVSEKGLAKALKFYKRTCQRYQELFEVEGLSVHEVVYEDLYKAPWEKAWETVVGIYDYLGAPAPKIESKRRVESLLGNDTSKHLRGAESYERLPNYRELASVFVGESHRNWRMTPIQRKHDSVSDLRIVHGQPLSNDFVFVVCFRNQEERIDRCLDSIINQAGGLDFGIVVVDDASTDAGLDKTLARLKETSIPCVVVHNDKRRFYTRNLFNSVHHLVTRSDSVVLEVDGDDHLAGPHVVQRVAEEYVGGALRTMGSFEADPSEVFEWGKAKADFGGPWDLDRCTSWIHLKTFRKSLFEKVPLSYFKERGSDRWLKMGEDMVVHPKMVELAGSSNRYIEDVLYVYDYSGGRHDMKDPDQARYHLDYFYRVPEGSYYADLRRREAKKRRAARLQTKADKGKSAVGDSPLLAELNQERSLEGQADSP